MLKTLLTVTLTLIVCLILLFLGRPYIKSWLLAGDNAVGTQSIPFAQPRAGAASPDANESNTIRLFQTLSPSVVFITTTDSELNLWTRRVREVPLGSGSGFFWDNQGHIVTNYHVIQNSSSAKVRLSDQRTFDAVLVGSSDRHDLAVLRINVPTNAPAPLQLGDSKKLLVGQSVYAIGNPFGLDHTLTSGIISALGRSIESPGKGMIEGLVQTDAAINPGNSGGPLLDRQGRLIGVNTAIYSPSGSSAGIGFSIPVDTVNRVVPQLISKGRYLRPVLGINMDDRWTNIIYRQYGVTGIVVMGVTPGSGAEQAGLQGISQVNGQPVIGDIIQSIEGRVVRTVSDLKDILDEYEPGNEIALSVLRENTSTEIKVKLTSPENYQ